MYFMHIIKDNQWYNEVFYKLLQINLMYLWIEWEWSSKVHMFQCFPVVYILGRNRRNALAWGGVPLGRTWELKKLMARPSHSRCFQLWIRCKLLVTAPMLCPSACCHALYHKTKDSPFKTVGNASIENLILLSSLVIMSASIEN